MAITKARKHEIITKHGKNAKDSGNTEVQIAILTEEINALTEHLKKSVKDLHSKSGIYKKSAARNRLLKYLQRTDEKSYKALVKKLNIREKN